MAKRNRQEIFGESFRDQTSAETFAISESTVRKGNHYIVLSSGIFHVDQKRELGKAERLIGIYANGAQI